MPKLPKLSFVMPTHNRQGHIGKSIASIIDQTVSDWELVIVDDHSDLTDTTESIVAAFNDPRIRYYRLPDNHGRNSASARNFGNALASAPLIAVADSDDIFYPHRAKLIIDSYAQEAWDVFYADFDIWDELLGQSVENTKYPIIPFELEKLKVYDFIPHGSVAYRRAIVLDNPYNSFFKRSSDYDLFTRLAAAGKKFYFCPQKVYQYRLHDSNLIRQFVAKPLDQFIRENRGWIARENSTALSIINDKPSKQQ